MPYFYPRRRYANRWYFRRRRWHRRPRRRPFTWRLRQTLRRRRPLYNRRYRVRKYYKRKRKLKFLRLKEYQPQTINKCHIRGTICLFQCGPHRLHYNNTQYMNTYTPEYWEGGGGWGQLKFTLASLFEQRDLLRNKWTKSNVALPLCRYLGCRFKFYREPNIDYIVYYSKCLPMLDTFYQHVNAHPYNMLLYKHKIIVRSQQSKPNRKPYKTLRIKPPEQYTNQWYFQADFANQGLLLLTATAADFDRPYLNPKAQSNSITIHYLNPTLFKSHNFKQANMGTAFWTPNNNQYYYIKLGHTNTIQDLIYVGQTTTNDLGKNYTFPTPDTQHTQLEAYLNRNRWAINFANIFHHEILNDEVILYVSQTDPRNMFKKTKTTTLSDAGLTVSSTPIIKKCRYNPDKDFGNNNTVFIKDIFTNSEGWDPPTDPDLVFDGFPLWCLLWGLEDWVKKYKKLQNMWTDYILVINTDTFSEKEQFYVIVDPTYLEGHSPYQDKYNPIDYNTWQPCLRTQMLTIESICTSGPLTCKTSTQSIEAHCTYDFSFKWGGCPNQLENITDPEKQKHYPTPHNIFEGIQIQDPETPPETELHPFDIRRHTITGTAAKRIKTDFKTTKLSPTDSRLNTEAHHQEIETLQTEHETSTEEEEETPLQQQLLRLKQHRKHLQHKLNRLISKTPNIKYSMVQ
nr:MAG: ORF1 [TTV-like mini virus]